MLLICSTLVTKSSKRCRLLAAIMFVSITMGMEIGMEMLLHPHVTLYEVCF